MKTRILHFQTILLTLLIAFPLHAQVRLPRLISNGMVLQRDADLKIWGWAAPGESVTVEFAGDRYEARADEAGEWVITLPPMQAGGPYTMEIRAGNTITLSDILVGDVWLCSGPVSYTHLTLPTNREV